MIRSRLIRPALQALFRQSSSGPTTGEQLKSRAVIQVEGYDAAEFLHGLTTNDISGQEQTLFCLFLNHRGRVQYEAFIHRNDDHFYVDCDAVSAPNLISHLNKYKLRRVLKIRSIEGMKVWATFDGSGDPRCPLMPSRSIRPDQPPGVKLVDGIYDRTRYLLGIAEGHEEVPQDALPLEYNGDIMNGISFTKGCYIGQELTARTYHTGVVRKRIMPVRLQLPLNSSPPVYDSIIVDHNDKKVGQLRGVLPDEKEWIGIGLIRVKEALEAEKLRLEREPESQVSVCIPEWWPQELVLKFKGENVEKLNR